MSAPSFEYRGITYLHTESPWDVKTNRHPTTLGSSWGWIDGLRVADGSSVCWNDDPGSTFTHDHAYQVIRIHNDWLKEQEPVAIRLVKAHRALETAEKAREEAEVKFHKADSEVTRLRGLIELLTHPVPV